MDAQTKARGRLTPTIRSVLAALPEASLWTAVTPTTVDKIGTQAGLGLAFPAWVAGVACLVGGIVGGLWLPDRDGSKNAPPNAALFVATGLVSSAAVLGGLGAPAAVVWLFTFWRGISAAGYGRYPYYLRRAVVGVLVAFGVSGLLFARAGLSLPALLTGLFVAAATGLGALLLWADSTIVVGTNTYSLPYTGWHYRVAMTAIAVVVGLPAVLLSAWTLWAGPAASGLGILGQSASFIAGVLLNLFAKILVVIMIPIFWLIGLLVAWLKGLSHPFTPTQGLLAGENPLPEWLRQAADKPLKSWHVPTFIILGALMALAVILIYRLVRSVVVSGSQDLEAEFEDLAPTHPSRKVARAGAGRGRPPLAGLPAIRAAYRAFLFRLAAVGRPRSPSTTPSELSTELGLGAEAQVNVETLTEAYIQARYGPPGRLDEKTERAALEAWGSLKTRLVRPRIGARGRTGNRPGS